MYKFIEYLIISYYLLSLTACSISAPFYIRNLTASPVKLSIEKTATTTLHLYSSPLQEKLTGESHKSMQSRFLPIQKDSSIEIYVIPAYTSIYLGKTLNFHSRDAKNIIIETPKNHKQTINANELGKQVNYHNSVFADFRYFWYDIK